MYGVIELKGGGFHYLEFLHYALIPNSFRDLKNLGLPSALSERLESLKGKTFKTETAFLKQLQVTFELIALVEHESSSVLPKVFSRLVVHYGCPP